ncbi:MAG: DOMON-like domain-containing protein [Hyphomonadaceae bacterium]|nr:DOMON-like domain-containing protein [Hyphomonadaceae bacterium]
MRVQLAHHRSTPSSLIHALEAEIDWLRPDGVQIRYRAVGASAGLRLPSRQPPARVDNLWQRTCFEAFFKRPGEQRYLEFNFSPSSQWAAYRFETYRAGMASAEEMSATVTARSTPARYELTATANVPPGPWRIALSAVIEAANGAKSFWAVAHPPGDTPDFHHDDCFALEVPAPGGA